MKQIEIFEIPSPCIGICQTGSKGYCIGCFRSREERLYWTQADDNAKRQIIRACNRRRKKAERDAYKKATINPTQNDQLDLWGDEQDESDS